MTDLFGQEAVPASHSAKPAMVTDSKILGTYGLISTGSSASNALQSSLESRLEMQKLGSTLFPLTWKGKATPSGRRYYQLVPLVRNTGGIASGLLPTPQARDFMPAHTAAYVTEKRRQGHGMANLNDFVAHEHLGLWPTPTASRRSGLQSHGKNAILGVLNPQWVAWLMGYPTNWLNPPYVPSATRSSRKSPSNSSSPHKKPSEK
jgi:hypothetical protein